jgi:hypothetical protein
VIEDSRSIDLLVSLNLSMGRRQGDLLAYIAAGYLKLNVVRTANRSSQTSLRRGVSNRFNRDGQTRPCYLRRLSFREQY